MPYEFVRSPQSGVQLSFFGLRELFSHHIVLSLDVIRKGSSASCVLTEAQLDTCRRTKRSVYKNLFTRRTPQWVSDVYQIVSHLRGEVKEKE